MAETRQEYERRQRAHRLRRREPKAARAANSFFREYFLSAVFCTAMAATILWAAVPMLLQPNDDYVRGFRIIGMSLTPQTAPMAVGIAGLLAAYAALCFYGIWRHRQRRLARERAAFAALDRLTAPDADG